MNDPRTIPFSDTRTVALIAGVLLLLSVATAVGQFQIDQHHVVEVGRQILAVAQIVDRLADRHGFRQRHHFALHQAAARSNQVNVTQQLANFQAACHDAARRVGLVAFAAAPGGAAPAMLLNRE